MREKIGISDQSGISGRFLDTFWSYGFRNLTCEETIIGSDTNHWITCEWAQREMLKVDKEKAEKGLSADQQKNSAEQKSEKLTAQPESSKKIDSAFDTPEMRREIAQFVKLVGSIRSQYRPNKPQVLDNESGQR